MYNHLSSISDNDCFSSYISITDIRRHTKCNDELMITLATIDAAIYPQKVMMANLTITVTGN